MADVCVEWDHKCPITAVLYYRRFGIIIGGALNKSFAGFVSVLDPKSDYYGSRGVTAPKSGILGGLETSKLREASQNPHTEA